MKDCLLTIHSFRTQVEHVVNLQLWYAKFLHGSLNPLVGDVLATIGFLG